MGLVLGGCLLQIFWGGVCSKFFGGCLLQIFGGVSAPDFRGVGGVSSKFWGGVCSKYFGGEVSEIFGGLKFFSFFFSISFPPKKSFWDAPPPPRDGQCVAGTHPTGMHSCFHAVFGEIWPNNRWAPPGWHPFWEILDPPLNVTVNTVNKILLDRYRSSMVNSNTVNSKFHFI